MKLKNLQARNWVVGAGLVLKSRYHQYFRLIYSVPLTPTGFAGTRRAWVTRNREEVMIDIQEGGRAAAVVALTAGVLFCMIFLAF